MDRFTTKKDFWGYETYYDKNGNKIGTANPGHVCGYEIRDDSGNVIGKVGKDYYGRTTITINNFSIFTGYHNRTLLDSKEPSDLEYCEECGEWDGGEGDCDCHN